MPSVTVFFETQVGKQNVNTNKDSGGVEYWLLKRYVVGIRENLDCPTHILFIHLFISLFFYN